MDTSKVTNIVNHYSFFKHLIMQGNKLSWWNISNSDLEDSPVWINRDSTGSSSYIGFNVFAVDNYKQRIKNSKYADVQWSKIIDLLLESFFHDCPYPLDFSEGIMMRFYLTERGIRKGPYFSRKIK